MLGPVVNIQSWEKGWWEERVGGEMMDIELVLVLVLVLKIRVVRWSLRLEHAAGDVSIYNFM